LKQRSASLAVESNLAYEFHDGLRLCALLEILSNNPLPHKPSTKTGTQHQRLANLNLAFQMISSAGIKLVACGPEDIEAQNEKLLLGVIWTLIQHFQISFMNEAGKSAKDSLLGWVKAHLQTLGGLTVKDFHQSWQDGVAFCALVKRALPDSIDLDSLGADKIETLNKAFGIAEQQLGIPRLLEAEDLVNSDRPDEHSIMTYVSLFPEVFARRGIQTPVIREDGVYVIPPPPLDPKFLLKNELDQLRTRLEKTEETARGADATIEELKTDNQSKSDEITQLKEEISKQTDTNGSLKDDNTSLKSENSSLKEEHTSLQEQITALKDENVSLKEEVSKLKQEHADHQCPDIAGAEIEVKKLKQQLEEEQEKSANNEKSNQQLIQELQSELEKQKELSTQEKSANAGEIAALNEQKTKDEEELEQLRKQLESKTENIAKTEERVRTLESALSTTNLALQKEAEKNEQQAQKKKSRFACCFAAS